MFWFNCFFKKTFWTRPLLGPSQTMPTKLNERFPIKEHLMLLRWDGFR